MGFFTGFRTDPVRETIRREQRALKVQLPRARWTRPEGQHLTLKFLGETAKDDLVDLKREMTSTLTGQSAKRSQNEL